MDIILLHGWGVEASRWKSIKTLLGKQGFRVHLFDLPGFGKEPSPPVAWSVDDYVRFVNDYTNSRQLKNFFLLGHSFGGRIAIKFAAAHPKKLRGLILFAAAGIKSQKRFKASLYLFMAKLGSFIFSLPLLNRLKDFAKRALYRLAGSGDYLQVTGAMKGTIKKVIDEDLTPLLHQVQTPTLIIWGDRDKTTPLYQGLIMKEKIKGAEFRLIEGAGHAWYRQEPDKFVKTLLPFLEKYKI